MSQTCALCGRISFRTHHEYETHRAIFHGLKTSLKPENLSGRTPAQIVKDAEATWLKPHLVELDKPLEITSSTGQHLDSCRCNDCFQKKLDALVESSERTAQELTEAEAKRGIA